MNTKLSLRPCSSLSPARKSPVPETFLFPVGLAQQEGKPPNLKSQGPYFLFFPIGWVLWILQVCDISARRPSGKSQHVDTSGSYCLSWTPSASLSCTESLSPVLGRGAWSLARILSGSGMATLQPLVPPEGQGDGGLKKAGVGWRASSVTVPPGAGLCGAVEDTDTLS